MEESLNSVYRQGRVADNSIGPLEIRVVKSGTFEELMDYAISRGASINQYKVPRCVNFTPIMELLDSRVVSAHFSPALPHWSPERRRSCFRDALSKLAGSGFRLEQTRNMKKQPIVCPYSEVLLTNWGPKPPLLKAYS
ncbi:hypothetical protein REPUB_Repub04eG0080400 [Reevesia pubescens]